MKIIQFSVPNKPLSINHIYGQGRSGHKFMKPEGKQLMATTALMAKQAMRAGGHEIITGPFSIVVAYYMLPKNEMDVTNCEKALIDAMQGIVFVNDKTLGQNKDPYYLEQGIYFSATFRKFISLTIEPRINVTITYYERMKK